jgi:hypothetical protein
MTGEKCLTSARNRPRHLGLSSLITIQTELSQAPFIKLMSLLMSNYIVILSVVFC